MKDNNYPTATVVNTTSDTPHVFIEEVKTVTIFGGDGKPCYRKDDQFGSDLLDVRCGACSSFDGRGFWLNDTFDWQIVRDEVGKLVLVPTKK